MKDRQKFWLEKGYTQENIENHLRFERRKSKESRDKRKKNNEENKEIITKIKTELLNKDFNVGRRKITVLSISPTVDGIGFWYKVHKIFKDGSEGDFRYFSYFEEYELKSFLEELNY